MLPQDISNAITLMGYGVWDTSSEFAEEWFLKWAEGTILGFMRNRIELNRAKGMLRTAMENIGEKKLSLIFMNIEQNPIYLPAMSREEKIGKLKILKRELNVK
jgi:hypothetical protein